MVASDPCCTQCSINPTYMLKPCQHTSCFAHCPGEIQGMCGVCGTSITSITHIAVSPRLQPVPPVWPISGSEIVLPGAANAMDFSRHGFGRDGSGNESDRPPLREQNNNTPTPGGGVGNPGATGGTRGRYVPPVMRTPPSPAIRPESSMSNDTFLSQIPEAVLSSNIQSMLAGVTPRGMTGYTPRSNASHAPTQTPTRYPTLDPYAGPNRRTTLEQFPDASRSTSFYNAADNDGMRSYESTPRTYRTPSNPNINNGAMSMPGTAVKQPSFAPAMAAAVPSFTPSVTGSRHSAQDSAAANAFGVDLSRAVGLARLIRQGATDNPLDPDFGNPGRSRRLPPESNNATMAAPQPRGRVMSNSSQALTVYESEPNTKGNAAAYLGTNTVELPRWFYKLGQGSRPNLEEVYEHLPVMEACRVAKPSSAGVIKITNIPYACSRSEIVAFLGRAAQIINMPEGSPYHAVHVMIDRGTGKTLDAYVELKHAKEAITVSRQYEGRIQAGRHAKIGDREVKVSVISQGELMAELFPFGKNLAWDHNGVPHISTDRDEFYPGYPSTGFNGFLTGEELVHLSKFAETPQRSPFMQRCLIRGYEHLISILHKYPWFAVEHVLLRERNELFDTTLRNVRALMGLLRKTMHQPRRDHTLPTTNTLQELAVAALTCPGFSEGQKVILIQNLEEAGYGNMTSLRGVNFRFGGDFKFAPQWPFFALVKQPGVSDDMVEYFASLMREGTNDTASLSLADMHSMRASNIRPSMFGTIRVEQGLTTMSELGHAELRAIEKILGRVLQRRQDTLGSRLAALSF